MEVTSLRRKLKVRRNGKKPKSVPRLPGLWLHASFYDERARATSDNRSSARICKEDKPMRFEAFSFGSIRIDGASYDHDVVIDRGQVQKRKEKASKKFREAFGHTPLSLEEGIPWKCRRLIVGTGTGALPVMKEVQAEAKRRKIELVVLPTAEAIELLQAKAAETNAILHVTC
jgi:hypothetical protein